MGDLWRLLETMALLHQTGTTLKQTTLHGTQPSSVIISRHVKAPTRTLPGTIAQHSAELLLLMNAQELPQPLQEPTLVGCTRNRALNPNRKVVRLRLAGSLPAASGISRRDSRGSREARPKQKGARCLRMVTFEGFTSVGFRASELRNLSVPRSVHHRESGSLLPSIAAHHTAWLCCKTL